MKKFLFGVVIFFSVFALFFGIFQQKLDSKIVLQSVFSDFCTVQTNPQRCLLVQEKFIPIFDFLIKDAGLEIVKFEDFSSSSGYRFGDAEFFLKLQQVPPLKSLHLTLKNPKTNTVFQLVLEYFSKEDFIPTYFFDSGVQKYEYYLDDWENFFKDIPDTAEGQIDADTFLFDLVPAGLGGIDIVYKDTYFRIRSNEFLVSSEQEAQELTDLFSALRKAYENLAIAKS